MKIATKFGLMMILLGAVALAAPAQNPPPAKVDYNKIVGNWSLEVNAGQEFYTLPLVLKVTDGKLEGTLSEQNGMFKDAPLTSIEFDGQTLKFEAKTPTPPDGAERPIKFDLKLAADKLEGLVSVADLGLSVPVTGVKK
ncbi:MAG: hypothetical protein Q8O91_10470 [Candidatus Aminicenantes bacterium]|nr:hypothetical protein [Candidatus Aminicenantes bacterium]